MDYSGNSPFYVAVQVGNLEIIKFLAENNAPTTKGEFSPSLLVLALNSAPDETRNEVINLIIKLSSKDDINAVDSSVGLAPITMAAAKDLSIVKLLQEYGATLQAKEGEASTPMLAAAESGSIENVQFFLDNGAQLSETNINGETVLHIAIASGNIELVKYLVQQGVSLDTATPNGNTATLYACRSFEMLQYLVDQGCKIHSNTLKELIINCNVDGVKLVLEKGEDFNAKDDEGFTPLMAAAEVGAIEIMQLLLDRGAEVNVTNEHGGTPLAGAVNSGTWEVVKLLLDKGASVELGEPSPLLINKFSRDPQILKALLEHGANPNVKTETGETPLLMAVSRGDEGDVRMLLEHGADVNAELDGITPVFYAVDYQQYEIAKILIEANAKV